MATNCRIWLYQIKATRFPGCSHCQLRSLSGIAAVDGEGDSDDKAGAGAAQP